MAISMKDASHFKIYSEAHWRHVEWQKCCNFSRANSRIFIYIRLIRTWLIAVALLIFPLYFIHAQSKNIPNSNYFFTLNKHYAVGYAREHTLLTCFLLASAKFDANFDHLTRVAGKHKIKFAIETESVLLLSIRLFKFRTFKAINIYVYIGECLYSSIC